MQLANRYVKDFYDFYEASIQHRAQNIMLSVGVSIDRRSHRYVTDTFNDDTVFSLVCMVCAQIKTHTGLISRSVNGVRWPLTEIQYRNGQDLIPMWKKNLDHFDNNFGLRTFMQRYGQDWKVRGQSGEDLREFGPRRWEGRRLLKIPGHPTGFELLCCPEDVQCNKIHNTEDICSECDIPLCSDCSRLLSVEKNVPKALSNDNMWGYVASITMRYQVRWIEMAAVLPYCKAPQR